MFLSVVGDDVHVCTDSFYKRYDPGMEARFFFMLLIFLLFSLRQAAPSVFKNICNISPMAFISTPPSFQTQHHISIPSWKIFQKLLK